ncbi:unnamed protein product, partial [marine sediment metagenome]
MKDLDLKILTLQDFSDLPLVKEDGKTFQENAIKKSREYQRVFGKIVLAEDSGLQVPAIGGRPGVYSARFAGKEQNDKRNIKKLLKLLKDIPQKKRKAVFRSVVAITLLDGKTEV